jgi:hypothetical protein
MLPCDPPTTLLDNDEVLLADIICRWCFPVKEAIVLSLIVLAMIFLANAASTSSVTYL